MKKLIAIILAAIMVLSLSAFGIKNGLALLTRKPFTTVEERVVRSFLEDAWEHTNSGLVEIAKGNDDFFDATYVSICYNSGQTNLAKANKQLKEAIDYCKKYEDTEEIINYLSKAVAIHDEIQKINVTSKSSFSERTESLGVLIELVSDLFENMDNAGKIVGLK